MTWTPDDRAVIGAFILAFTLVLSWRTERAWYQATGSWLARHTYRRLSWIRFVQRKRVRWHALPAFAWELTVGTWFTQRRFVQGFLQPKRPMIRVPNPDEHSRGLMVARRDINAGWWS